MLLAALTIQYLRTPGVGTARRDGSGALAGLRVEQISFIALATRRQPRPIGSIYVWDSGEADPVGIFFEGAWLESAQD